MRIELPRGTPAELVVPEGAEPTRGLVLLPDIMGLRPLFDEHVERLATATGWAVCSPELWPGRESLTLEERLAAAGTLRDDEVLADAADAAAATGASTVGVTGFCIGGMYTIKAAATGRYRRAVSFYGMIRLPETWHGEGQGEPLAALDRGRACPLLAVVGTADVWTPPEDVEALEANGAQVVRYEGAEHGFVHDPSRPAHRPDDAADAWRRALEFLAA